MLFTSFDIDELVRSVLMNSPEVRETISGGIYYQDERPANSNTEDIVINTIAITQTYLPQLATSNINVFVPDKVRRIGEDEQRMPNYRRLMDITKAVLKAINGAHVVGLRMIPESQTILPEDSAGQHFCNIRIGWNIQTEELPRPEAEDETRETEEESGDAPATTTTDTDTTTTNTNTNK